MDKRIPGKLRLKYGADKQVQQFPRDAEEPTEYVCEVEPSDDHPEYSVAVAVIEKSAPHHHLRTTETYRVLSGRLVLDLIEPGMRLKTIHLLPGKTLDIAPLTVHSATSDIERPAWVEVTSHPGWTEEDHIIDSIPQDEQ